MLFRSTSGQVRTLDLADAAAVEAAVDALEREVAPIDILVNATHEANIKPLLEASLADWQREIDRNVTTTFVACQAVGRRMVARGGGRIINLVSILHDRAVPNCALFSASQAAILGLTRTLGIEWGRGPADQIARVTVNALGLGFYEGVAGPQNDADLHGILQRYIPLRRLGEPADLQGALVYLASDTANYMQGELVMVDGAIASHA